MKKSIDPQHTLPLGAQRQSQLDYLKSLLELRTIEDIENIVKWGLMKKFWCSRISTPKKLHDNFSEIWTEFVLSQKTNPEDIENQNKRFVEEKLSMFEDVDFNGKKISILNKYLEIGNGINQPSCINYSEKDFKEKVYEAFEKWQIQLPI